MKALLKKLPACVVSVIKLLERGIVRIWKSSQPVLTYLYLVRLIVLALLVMAALPLLSWLGPLRSLTVGAFDASTKANHGAILGEASTNTGWLLFVRCMLTTTFLVAACRGIETIASTFASGARARYPDVSQVADKAAGVWRLLAFLTALGATVWLVVVSGIGQDGHWNWEALGWASAGSCI